MKKMLSFVLVAVMLLTLFSGCGTTDQHGTSDVLQTEPSDENTPSTAPTNETTSFTESDENVTPAEKNPLYGIGEPLVGRVADLDSASSKATAYLLEAMNFGAIREWMHMTSILEDPTTVNEDAVENYSNALNLYDQLEMEITGMSHRWFVVKADGTYEATSRMYRRDTSENSLYIQSLQAIQQSWKLMAETFPQVDLWEVGNEWNTETFLNVYPADEAPLTDEERMEIAVDMMYYAYKGIKEGNPNAQVVSFSPAVAMPSFTREDGIYSPSFTMPGYGIALALDRVYTNIESGDFPAGAEPVTDPDQYFDLMAWHPYMLTHMLPFIVSDQYPATDRFMRMENIDALWLNVNDMAYNVMVAHGDGDKQVILSEIGFNDMMLPGLEDLQAQMYVDMFAMIEEYMPYVKTVHVFRLYTASGAGGLQEYQFGMFWMDMPEYNEWLSNSQFSFLGGYSEIAEDYAPRKKAYVLQKIFGGTMSLELPQEIRDALGD